MAEGVRRRPVQQRSIERVARILDACAHLLDEVGYDDLTAVEVARRAGVPTGTIYQFFDGKTGMLRALAMRNMDLLLHRLRGHLREGVELTWPSAAEMVMDETLDMRRTVPGFSVMDFGDSRVTGHTFLPPGSSPEGGDALVEALYDLATREAGLPPLPDPMRMVSLAIEIGSVALKRAFVISPTGDVPMLDLAHRLIRLYFTEVASPERD
ncbi:TetR/AcrR family transcriptional regulator [Spirillospora sp. NPDC052269]